MYLIFRVISFIPFIFVSYSSNVPAFLLKAITLFFYFTHSYHAVIPAVL